MPLLSEIEFGSFLVYSPRGVEQISIQSKKVCLAVKEDKFIPVGSPTKNVRAIPFLIEWLRSKIAGTSLDGFFDSRPIFVPAPRSSPVKPGSLYPTEIICKNLVQNGFGSDTQILLERAVQVPKAAFSKPSERPTVHTHFASLRVKNGIELGNSIMVVDDVVTSGSMLLASVSKLKDSFPSADIRAFALIRTMSGQEVAKIVGICTGKISLRGQRTSRTP
jgi:hypothetical protein